MYICRCNYICIETMYIDVNTVYIYCLLELPLQALKIPNLAVKHLAHSQGKVGATPVATRP